MVLSRQRCGGLLVSVPDSVETFGSLCYVFGQDTCTSQKRVLDPGLVC